MTRTEEVDAAVRDGQRDFWLLWMGQGVSEFGSAMTGVVCPLLVLWTGGSPFQAGLIGVVGQGSRLAVRLVAGLIVDRFPKRSLLIWCDAGRAVLLAVLASAVAGSAATLGLLLAVLFMEGGLSAVFFAADRAVVSVLLPREQLTTAIGRSQIYLQLAAIAAPPVGVTLFALGRFVPFACDAVSYLVSLGFILRTRMARLSLPRASGAGERGVSIGALFAGWRWVWHEKHSRAGLLYLAGVNVLLAAAPLAVIIDTHAAGRGPGGVAAVLSCAGVGGVTGALALPRLRRTYTDGRLLTSMAWSWPVLLVPLVVPFQIVVVCCAFFALGTTVAPIQGIISGYLAATVPRGLQGRVHAAVNLLANGLTPAAPAAVGALATASHEWAAGVMLIAVGTVIALAASLSSTLQTFGGHVRG